MRFCLFSVARASNVETGCEAELPRVVPRPRRDAENEEISPEVLQQLGLAPRCPLCYESGGVPGAPPRAPLSVAPVSRQLTHKVVTY
jgi:hypothetical protein